MNFISKLFSRSQVDCPRCLAKREVDLDDIIRLKRELRWKPGICVYCRGTGSVSARMLSRVSVDNVYLTTEISEEERRRLISGDQGAMQRAKLYETQIDDLIAQIEYLYFVGNLDADKIADFYFISKAESEASSTERENMLDYVRRVIEYKTKK